MFILQHYDYDQTVTQGLYSYSISESLGQTQRGNPCYGLQGFPMELPELYLVVRILEECMAGQILVNGSSNIHSSQFSQLLTKM